MTPGTPNAQPLPAGHHPAHAPANRVYAAFLRQQLATLPRNVMDHLLGDEKSGQNARARPTAMAATVPWRCSRA
jgi:hypothetical protein